MKKIILVLLLLTFKISFAQLTLQWSNVYYSFQYGFNNPTKITTDSFGNVYVLSTSDSVTSMNNIFTIKYNSSGVEQ